MPINTHLIEVGFMGAGKTTVGKAVADRLGVFFYDTDARIEKISGRLIPEIFSGDGGEPEFREFEVEALSSILNEKPGIVSTGGGIVSTRLGREALIGCDLPVVWLKLDFPTTQARVDGDAGTVRPLFSDPAKASGLFAARQQWYREVSTAVVDASQPFDTVVENVIRIVEN